jgi:hypothetical protein
MTTPRNIQTILILTVSITLASCKFSNRKSEPVWSDLPEVTSLDNLKQTDFVTTLENPISVNKNIIYAPAFLYAWNKIKEELKFPIIADNTNSPDFKLLNQSISYQKSLTETEYSATAEVFDRAIIARAFFNKTLPFETHLQISDDPILFNKTKVSAFGMYYYNEDAIKFTKILYYKDDNNFILKLSPKDKQHEIILVKGVENYQTLKDAIKLTNDLIDEGKQEQINTKLSWKYEIVDEDIFSIPAIQFNIATHYKNLEGQSFSTKDNKKYSFNEAYQRTGFILNENGAIVESVGVAALDTVSVPLKTHPKKMIFDKQFLIIIKRTGKTNPYFVMKVANTELLTKK